jgi:hypothetical protein
MTTSLKPKAKQTTAATIIVAREPAFDQRNIVDGGPRRTRNHSAIEEARLAVVNVAIFLVVAFLYHINGGSGNEPRRGAPHPTRRVPRESLA